MRFPLNVSRQNRCPVCKKRGPGTNSPHTPRPEAAALSFIVYSHVHGRSYPVFLGSELMLSWDSGICKHPQARASLGASFVVAKRDGRRPDVGQMEIQFCSTHCLRQFLMEAIDELDHRIAAVEPEVRAARQSSSRGTRPASVTRQSPGPAATRRSR
jgi:hypothetical protein